jgi:methionine biosynthesis protein MetW
MEKHTKIGYDLVISLVEEGSRVLDLGCGDGRLLHELEVKKNIKGAGVEISEDGVSKCVEKGLYCYQGDIDEGLSDYRDKSFDYVILNQTIQNTKRPEYVIKEIMRIGRIQIVTFPNFGHISIRLKLLTGGIMPVNSLFPYDWHESPDIHKLSIKNFEDFCTRCGYRIKKRYHFLISESGSSIMVKFLPNLIAQYGFFVLNGD